MKKFEKVIIVFNILLMILLILNRTFCDLDEIWNYNFARNIVNGNVPYLDFNMIIFPLFPNILALFLKVLGEELIVYRFFQILIYIGIIILVFKLLEKLKLNNRIINYLIVSMLLSLLFLYCVGEYNIFCLFLILLIINLEISIKQDIKRQCLIGFLVGITFTVKQSIGIVTFVVSIILIFLKNINIIEKIKTASVRVLFFLIPLFIMLGYLFYNNAFEYFLDYTILGLQDFTQNKLSYLHLLIYEDYIIRLLALFMLFIYVFIIYKVLKYKLKDSLLIILIGYSLTTISMMVPIMNASHFIPANILIIIIFLYLINSEKTENESCLIKIPKIINIFSIILLLIIICILVYNIFCFNKYKHYKYINTLSNDIRLSEVIKFLEDNPNTYILDASAAMYMIPIDKYNGIFDMVLIGNIGKNGEEKIISLLKEQENVYLLLNKNGNWQNVIKIIEYVEKNYEYVGKVSDLYIYK